MPRGGHREGAGAKPGNVNALKTGRWSHRVRALPPAEREAEIVRLTLTMAKADSAEWFVQPGITQLPAHAV